MWSRYWWQVCLAFSVLSWRESLARSIAWAPPAWWEQHPAWRHHCTHRHHPPSSPRRSRGISYPPRVAVAKRRTTPHLSPRSLFETHRRAWDPRDCARTSPAPIPAAAHARASARVPLWSGRRSLRSRRRDCCSHPPRPGWTGPWWRQRSPTRWQGPGPRPTAAILESLTWLNVFDQQQAMFLLIKINRPKEEKDLQCSVLLSQNHPDYTVGLSSPEILATLCLGRVLSFKNVHCVTVILVVTMITNTPLHRMLAGSTME